VLLKPNNHIKLLTRVVGGELSMISPKARACFIKHAAAPRSKEAVSRFKRTSLRVPLLDLTEKEGF
jgi:hypothetical protein